MDNFLSYSFKSNNSYLDHPSSIIPRMHIKPVPQSPCDPTLASPLVSCSAGPSSFVDPSIRRLFYFA